MLLRELKMNVYEILKAIRLDDSTKNYPVFFLIAIPREEALKKSRRIGNKWINIKTI